MLTFHDNWRLASRIDAGIEKLLTGDPVFEQLVGQRASVDALLDDMLLASAILAREASEATEAWARRQSRLLPATVVDRIERAAARSDEDADLESILNEIETSGLTGILPRSDPLSSDERTDIPARKLAFPLSTWAGIERCATMLNCKNEVYTSAFVSIGVKLPRENRGAHMSRLQTSIIELESEEFASIDEYVAELGRRTVTGQPSKGSRIDLEADFKRSISSEITGRPSAIPGNCKIKSEFASDGKVISIRREVTVGIMTACPCTLMFSQLKAERDLGLESRENLPPTFTHSQPGVLTVGVSAGDVNLVPSLDGLLAACSTAAHLREAVLKRHDEHALVERCHRRPQFAEDVCRSAAVQVASRSGDAARVSVEARLDESIHPHQAVASIDSNADEILRSRQ